MKLQNTLSLHAVRVDSTYSLVGNWNLFRYKAAGQRQFSNWSLRNRVVLNRRRRIKTFRPRKREERRISSWQRFYKIIIFIFSKITHLCDCPSSSLDECSSLQRDATLSDGSITNLTSDGTASEAKLNRTRMKVFNVFLPPTTRTLSDCWNEHRRFRYGCKKRKKRNKRTRERKERRENKIEENNFWRHKCFQVLVLRVSAVTHLTNKFSVNYLVYIDLTC